MARTHAEVREAAREEAFEEARRVEKDNYKRHLTDRISRCIKSAVDDFMKQECFGNHPRVDVELTRTGTMLISLWTERPRKIVAKISVTMEVDE